MRLSRKLLNDASRYRFRSRLVAVDCISAATRSRRCLRTLARARGNIACAGNGSFEFFGLTAPRWTKLAYDCNL